MPDGTTRNAQVAIACLPAGQRPNKTQIFISGVTDTRAFLAWLRASSPGGLMAQLKSEKLMVVPSTADGFRAAVLLHLPPWSPQGESLSQSLRKPKPLQTIWRLSFSR